MKRARVARPLWLAALAVAGCGVTSPAGGDPSAHTSPSTSQVTAASSAPPPAAELPTPPPLGTATSAHLTITGSTTYHVGSTRPRGPCGASVAGYAADLDMTLSGQTYVLSIELADYGGPGGYSIPPERVSLHTETGAGQPALVAATGGRLTVNADQRSGSIDATMSDRSRITGTWACGG